jgi:DNA-binding MarR family transcriptional regulator
MHVRDLDDHLCATARLAVLTTLYPGESVSFSDLKGLTGIADGNLHVQTRRLAQAGLLSITKLPSGNRTQTMFRITDDGAVRLRIFAERLAGLVVTGEGAIVALPARERYDESRVW